MRTIVAGSRTGAVLSMVQQAMEDAPWEITTVISGTARGVDLLGEVVAGMFDIPVDRYPAKWDDLKAPGAVIKHNSHGPYNALAGYQRNTLMARHADALVAVWDGKSHGTKHMIDQAKLHGLKIHIHHIETNP